MILVFKERNYGYVAMVAEWLRQGCNPPCGWRDAYKFFLGSSVDQ